MSFSGIREQDPLKQGLKLFLIPFFLIIVHYSRARSTKTRIETFTATDGVHLTDHGIREQDPLKQGLKPYGPAQTPSCRYSNSRARSTKTRIETEFPFISPGHLFRIREQDPLKQGLKPKPSVQTIQKIAKSLGVPMEELLK